MSFPCGECCFYDPVGRHVNSKAAFGRCALRSVYPKKEGPGQVFPPDVKRVANEEDPAKPYIVKGAEVDE